MNAFRALSAAMVKGFVRDRVTLFFTIAFPVFFIVLFSTIFSGSGASKQTVTLIGDVPVVQQMPAKAKHAMGDYVTFTHTKDRSEALEQVRKGDIGGAVEQRGDRVTVHVSRADQVGSAQVNGILQQITTAANQRAAGAAPRYHVVDRAVESTELKSIQYVTPGFTAYGICVAATFGAGLTMIEWRARKVLRRLQLAPIPIWSIVGARVVVSLGVAIVQLAIFLGVGLMLGLRLQGDWWASIPLVLAGALAFMAIGVLVACIARTSEGGAGLTNMITLPMSFLSGAFIPLDLAPDWIKGVAKILPLGWLVEGLSDVLVRNQSAATVVWPTVMLLAFTAVVTAVGAKWFRWDAA